MQATVISRSAIATAPRRPSVAAARPAGVRQSPQDRTIVAGVASVLAAALLCLALLPIFASAPSALPAGGPGPMPAPAPLMD